MKMPCMNISFSCVDISFSFMNFTCDNLHRYTVVDGGLNKIRATGKAITFPVVFRRGQ